MIRRQSSHFILSNSSETSACIFISCDFFLHMNDNLKSSSCWLYILGKEKIEATELLEVVFSIDDNELGSNTAVNSENTQLVTGSQSRQQNLQMSTSSVERQTNQRIIQAQPANPPESSIPSLPSLSVSSLENKTTEAGKWYEKVFNCKKFYKMSPGSLLWWSTV